MFVPGIQTKAVKKDGDYIINGGKMWTTTGFQADWMCLLANTSDGQAHQNKSLICLPMDAKGKKNIIIWHYGKRYFVDIQIRKLQSARKYSRPSLSQLRLSRITAYLEEKS